MSKILHNRLSIETKTSIFSSCHFLGVVRFFYKEIFSILIIIFKCNYDRMQNLEIKT